MNTRHRTLTPLLATGLLAGCLATSLSGGLVARAAAADVVPTFGCQAVAPSDANGSGGTDGTTDVAGALDTFGPLASVPNDITLPQGPTDQAPVVSLARVPGGVLVALRSGTNGPFTGSMLTLVNHDGTVRWTTCSTSSLTVYAGDPARTPTSAVAILTTQNPDGSATDAVNTVNLANGTAKDVTTQVAKAAGVSAKDLTFRAASPLSAWFGGKLDRKVTASSRLARLDLFSFASTSADYPKSLIGKESGTAYLAFTRSRDLYVNTNDGVSPITALRNNGVWTTNAAQIEASYGPIVVYGENGFRRVTPAGQVMWTSTVQDTGHEGFDYRVDGNTVVAATCKNNDKTNCTNRLVGIDAATGKVVWTNTNFATAAEVADGYTLALGDPAPAMLDSATGQVVQTLPADAHFYNGCCGEENVFTQRLGGIVAAVDGVHLRLWYPKGSGFGGKTLSLAG